MVTPCPMLTRSSKQATRALRWFYFVGRCDAELGRRVTFQVLLRIQSGHFDHRSPCKPLLKLQVIGAANGAQISVFLAAFCLLASYVTSSKRCLALSVSLWCLTSCAIASARIVEAYCLPGTSCQGDLSATSNSLGSVGVKWLAVSVLETNKTPVTSRG